MHLRVDARPTVHPPGNANRAALQLNALEVGHDHARVDDGDVKHLHWLRDTVGEDLLDAVVITMGVPVGSGASTNLLKIHQMS